MAGVDPIGMALSGFQLLGTFLSANTDAKNRMASAEAAKSQAESDQRTALQNVGILNQQIDMFTTQQGEVMADIGEQGQIVQSDRQAVAAASGMGSAGTSRTQYKQTERRVERDIGRVQSFMDSQNSIYGMQMDQAQEQADEYGRQATFAENAYNSAKQAKKTWLNPFD